MLCLRSCLFECNFFWSCYNAAAAFTFPFRCWLKLTSLRQGHSLWAIITSPASFHHFPRNCLIVLFLTNSFSITLITYPNFAFFNNCGFHCEGQNLSKTGEGQNLSKPKFAFLSNCGFDCEGQNLSRTGKGQKLSKRLKLEQLGIGIKHAL